MPETVKKFTYEDLLVLPEGQRAEIINGQLEAAAARPNLGHRHVTAVIDRSIGSRFGGVDSEWLIEIEPDVQFGQNILSPDLAGWKRINRGILSPLENLVSVIPDWTCEILSPSSGRRDRVEKFKIYQETGVKFYWIVDPINRTIESYVNELTKGQWMRLGVWGGDDLARIEPFQDFEIDLSTFWVV